MWSDSDEYFLDDDDFGDDDFRTYHIDDSEDDYFDGYVPRTYRVPQATTTRTSAGWQHAWGPPGVCRYWYNNLSCPFGVRCKFRHAGDRLPTAAAAQSPTIRTELREAALIPRQHQPTATAEEEARQRRAREQRARDMACDQKRMMSRCTVTIRVWGGALRPMVASKGDVDTCCICLDEFQAGVRVAVVERCQHMQHERCLRECVQLGKSECPQCRQPFSW